MKNYIIALDVDEVCADLMSAWLNRYNDAYGDNRRVEEVHDWEIINYVKPECGEKIYDFLTPDIYDEVLPMPGALEAVQKLKDLGRVIFVTAGNPDAKMKWLRQYGFLDPGRSHFDKNFYSAKDKSLIRADFLFDDYVVNVEAFPGNSYLVQTFHNLGTQCSRPRLPGFGLKDAPEVVARHIKLDSMYRAFV